METHQFILDAGLEYELRYDPVAAFVPDDGTVSLSGNIASAGLVIIEGPSLTGGFHNNPRVWTVFTPIGDLDIEDYEGNEISDPQEIVPGGYVFLNNDDDDQNDEPTSIKVGPSPGESDLLKLTLRTVEPSAVGGQYALVFGTGVIRVWKNSDRTDAVNSGDFIFNAASHTNLYVEGLSSDESETIEMVWTKPGQGYHVLDTVKVTVVATDLDIDSDNSDQFAPPTRSHSEDDIEDQGDAQNPGKVIVVSNGDADDDGIPDDLDGYDADGVPGNDDDLIDDDNGQNADVKFVPITLAIPEHVPITYATMLWINYEASSPGGTGGRLRLWTENANVARDKRDVRADADGNFVGSGAYTNDNMERLGLTESTREVTLYVEAIDHSYQIGDIEIDIRFKLGSASSRDLVRLTAIAPIDVEIDGISEKWEENPGAIIWLNSDFSKQVFDPNDPNEPGLPRYLPDYQAEAEGVGHIIDPQFASELTPASLYFPSIENGVIEFDFLDSRLELWTQQQWPGFEPAGQDWWKIRPAVEITPMSETLNFWIEGMDASGSGFGIHDIRVENNTPGWSSVYSAAGGFANGAIDDTANYTVVNIGAAVDGDRDGQVTHTNSHDRQLTFWYNNDREKVKEAPWPLSDPDYQTDDTTFASPVDWSGGEITLRRDFEDFANLQLRVAPKLLENSLDTATTNTPLAGELKASYRIGLRRSPEASDSQINLYITENGDPLSHVNDSSTMDQILDDWQFTIAGSLSSPEQQQLNLQSQTTVAPEEGLFAYLFEATGSVHQTSSIVFTTEIEYPNGTTTKREVEVDLDLRNFEDFYDRYEVPYTDSLRKQVYFNSFEDVHFDDANPKHQSLVHGQPFFTAAENVVLVHGWNMQQEDNARSPKPLSNDCIGKDTPVAWSNSIGRLTTTARAKASL